MATTAHSAEPINSFCSRHRGGDALRGAAPRCSRCSEWGEFPLPHPARDSGLVEGKPFPSAGDKSDQLFRELRIGIRVIPECEPGTEARRDTLAKSCGTHRGAHNIHARLPRVERRVWSNVPPMHGLSCARGRPVRVPRRRRIRRRRRLAMAGRSSGLSCNTRHRFSVDRSFSTPVFA
jgi:hypothetical protein